MSRFGGFADSALLLLVYLLYFQALAVCVVLLAAGEALGFLAQDHGLELFHKYLHFVLAYLTG